MKITVMSKLSKSLVFLFCAILLFVGIVFPESSIQAGKVTVGKILPSQSGYFSPVATQAVLPNGWEQLGGNPQRTGYVDDQLPASWKVKWIWNGPQDGGGPASDHLAIPKNNQPVMGDGKMFLGHQDGVMRAVSLESGKEVWSSINLGAPIVNTAAYDEETGSVYTATSDGRFWRLNTADGQVVRSNRPGGQILMAPLLVGDVIYIGTTGGILYAFDKETLAQVFTPYDAGAALIASPAYSGTHFGLIVVLAEDKSVHCLQAHGLSLRWRVVVNGDFDSKRETVFADTYPVVSERYDVVIVRSYLDWEKMWFPDGGAPSTPAEVRQFLSENPTYQSFFVLSLNSGEEKFVAPVLVGAIGNGGDFESPPPQVVVKKFADGDEAAYLLWRTRQACRSSCDGREDTTIGEMDLKTGEIRFVQDYKNAGSMRLPTDEQSPLSMAGDVIFHAHWMLLGSIKIIDRSADLGRSYADPIRALELPPVLNTLASGSCGNPDNHYCAGGMINPCDGFKIDAGFYIYEDTKCIYDQFWSTPVRSAVIDQGTIFWKTVDGAVIALGRGQ